MLKKIKDKFFWENVRSYGEGAGKKEGVYSSLKRKENKFYFEFFCFNSEHDDISFVLPLDAKALLILQEIVKDIRAIKQKHPQKSYKIRFRQGEIDLVVTYQYAQDEAMPHQRSIPLTSKIVSMFEEMYVDAQTIVDDTFVDAEE